MMPQLPFPQTPIYSYDLQTNYKRDVWLYKHGHYDGLNSEIDQFDWNSHLSSLNDIDEMSSKFSNKYIELAKNTFL
jgi:hypothetical protein